MVDQATGGAPAVQSVGSDRGIGWWSESWNLFMKNAGMWIVLRTCSLRPQGSLPAAGSAARSRMFFGW